MADLEENIRTMVEVAQIRGSSALARREQAVIREDKYLAAAMAGKAAAYREIAQLLDNALNGVDIVAPSVSMVMLDTNRRPLARTPRGGMSASRKAQVRRKGGGFCHYCGKQPNVLEIEHIVPRALGGTVALYNLVTACLTCNDDKAAGLWAGHCDICDHAITTWMARQMRILWENWPTELKENHA